MAWYITLGWGQFPFKGHLVFILQLQAGVVDLSMVLVIFLLCFFIICAIYSVQL